MHQPTTKCLTARYMNPFFLFVVILTQYPDKEKGDIAPASLRRRRDKEAGRGRENGIAPPMHVSALSGMSISVADEGNAVMMTCWKERKADALLSNGAFMLHVRPIQRAFFVARKIRGIVREINRYVDASGGTRSAFAIGNHARRYTPAVRSYP